MSACPDNTMIFLVLSEPTSSLDIFANLPIMESNRTRQGSERKPILKPAGHFILGGLR